jgi:hypothetical protein
MANADVVIRIEGAAIARIALQRVLDQLDEIVARHEPDAADAAEQATTELCNELLANAPESYDGDDAIEGITVRYVRDLEAALARVSALITPAAQMASTPFGDGKRYFRESDIRTALGVDE